MTIRKLSDRKKAELRLIAELTLGATLAAEERLSRLVGRTKATRSKLARKNS